MLNWLLKTFAPARTTPAATAKTSPKTPPPAAAPAVPKPPKPVVDWAPSLQAARGDDTALLALAQNADVLAVKLQAVEALASEDALRQAERLFRNHDRKVHRLAKQRLEAAVATREARAHADALLARTQALLAGAEVPANHLVALDRDWAALPAASLDAAQRDQFTALRAQLDAQVRQQAEQLRQQQRQWQLWQAEVQQRLASWPGELQTLAAQGDPAAIEPLLATAQALQATRPTHARTDPLDQALANALQSAQQRQASMALAPAPEPTEAPPASPELAEPAPAAPAPRPPKAPKLSPARQEEAAALLSQAETALAEGHVGPAQQHLQALERSVAAEPGAHLPGTLRHRQQALWAELNRLKGWQRWGGDRARDDLAAEAEALAALVPAAPAPASAEAPADASPDRAPGAAPDAAVLATAEPVTSPAADGPARLPKLNLKSHADAIRQLRQRWKELDRAGGPASAAQWQRFDSALQTAYLPVAAQQAQVQAERQANLATREALLATLDQWPLPSGEDGVGPAAWRDTLRELDRFQQAWRQLGPLEHTVPADARPTLQQRLQTSLARLEQPLDAARRQAAAQREPLIAQAETLASARLPLPEALRQVRDLQAAWQEAARQIPLARAAEAALWARFKAATDQVYAQREAQFAEREAAQATGVAEREALLRRLGEVAADATAADITRTLAEVDAAWRQASELPRAVAAPLEAQLRAAREPLQQRLAQAKQQRWQAQRTALAARLAQCEAREDSTETAHAEAQWATTAPLPKAWEQALAQRWQRPVQAGPLAAAEVDAALLQLEVAWDLPSAPEWQEARRQLKLQGLKQALEARQASAPQAAEGHWLAMLKQSGLSPAQRARLAAVVAALPAELASRKD